MRIPDRVPEDGSPLERSFAACLAAIVEAAPGEVPVGAAARGDARTAWRTWLATRGLGLVALADPGGFAWPGPWIAVLPADADADADPGGDGGGARVAALAYGSPSGIMWRPLGGEQPLEAVVEGWVVAAHDIALWAPTATMGEASRDAGRVEVIAVSDAAGAPMRTLARATAIAGRGLEGDRYAAGAGTFSDPASNGHDLTLVEAECLDALVLPSGRRLAYADARRNVVTRGIDLNALVGRRFRVGDVECVGRRLCEPCSHLERLTERGTLRGLVHRGGLRADVLGDGVIEVGAAVTAEPAAVA